MAYELYYAFVMPSSTLEFSGFIVWFLMDATFATVALFYAYPPSQRKLVAFRTIVGVAVGVVFFQKLCEYYPDEREQVTAYWTGWLLETPIGWGELYHLIKRGDTKGQSLEIWFEHLVPTHSTDTDVAQDHTLPRLSDSKWCLYVAVHERASKLGVRRLMGKYRSGVCHHIPRSHLPLLLHQDTQQDAGERAAKQEKRIAKPC